MICCVCGRDRDPAQTIVLTPEERAAAQRLTKEPVADSYPYCKPCWAIISDKRQGAELLKGLLQAGLRRAGVPNADSLAGKYREFVLEKGTKKPVS